MKSYILILFSICTLTMHSQWLWDFGVNASAANYLGDIGGGAGTRRDFVSDLKLAKTRWNFGGFARYKYSPKISLKLAMDYIRLEGDDALSANPGRRFRNFNFRNDVYDLALTGEYFSMKTMTLETRTVIVMASELMFLQVLVDFILILKHFTEENGLPCSLMPQKEFNTEKL